MFAQQPLTSAALVPAVTDADRAAGKDGHGKGEREREGVARRPPVPRQRAVRAQWPGTAPAGPRGRVDTPTSAMTTHGMAVSTTAHPTSSLPLDPSPLGSRPSAALNTGVGTPTGTTTTATRTARAPQPKPASTAQRQRALPRAVPLGARGAGLGPVSTIAHPSSPTSASASASASGSAASAVTHTAATGDLSRAHANPSPWGSHGPSAWGVHGHGATAFAVASDSKQSERGEDHAGHEDAGAAGHWHSTGEEGGHEGEAEAEADAYSPGGEDVLPSPDRLLGSTAASGAMAMGASGTDSGADTAEADGDTAAADIEADNLFGATASTAGGEPTFSDSHVLDVSQVSQGTEGRLLSLGRVIDLRHHAEALARAQAQAHALERLPEEDGVEGAEAGLGLGEEFHDDEDDDEEEEEEDDGADDGAYAPHEVDDLATTQLSPPQAGSTGSRGDSDHHDLRLEVASLRRQLADLQAALALQQRSAPTSTGSHAIAGLV